MMHRYALYLMLSFMFLSSIHGTEIDQSTLPVAIERSFPQLEFDRPIVLTDAGDGTDRVFIAGQLGVIHLLANDQSARRTETFLDIRSRVVYKDRENEEGFLGLAFHPKYSDNGEFFVYYTTTDAPHTSVISRFRVSADDPNRADAGSEEELLRIKQPFWNHNGGTIVFGPDGCLYVGLGDGGKANDPMENGQDLGTLLGTILRIDVDSKSPGLAYGIPDDNPFVDRPGSRGEIWAYGLRNVWRMSFDRQTGALWAADVGQDLWEEINIVRRGGNYGWNLREAMHPFGRRGVGPRDDLIDPIWEYHHDVGKSITGGHVYRGRQVPELIGKYLYADYVTGQIWALEYDADSGQVTANHPIAGNIMPVLSFGEDQHGEVYFLTQSGQFGWIHRFRSAAPGAQESSR